MQVCERAVSSGAHCATPASEVIKENRRASRTSACAPRLDYSGTPRRRCRRRRHNGGPARLVRKFMPANLRAIFCRQTGARTHGRTHPQPPSLTHLTRTRIPGEHLAGGWWGADRPTDLPTTDRGVRTQNNQLLAAAAAAGVC